MKRNAYWIWQTDQFIYEKQSVFLRRTFDCPEEKSLSVKVSADSRYKLYVNGHYVISGPMKSDKFRKYYDTVDITPYLQEGKNVIAAHVLRFPEDYLAAMNFHCGPISLVGSSRGGFWLDSNDADISTDSRWKCKADASYQFREAEESKYAGDQELCLASLYEQGWYSAEYDDSDWADAALVCPSDFTRLGGVLYEWQLYPRTIPLLQEISILPKAITKQSADLDFTPLLQNQAVVIPPHTDTYFDVDMGELVNAYVSLPMTCSADGADITLLYSESYQTPDGCGGYFKGMRDNAASGELFGETECYIAVSGEQRYEPFWLRVFRFLRIKISTGAAEVQLQAPTFRLIGYPLQKQGSFLAENPVLNQMWQVSVRTLERCMLDTYVDCPYYEQMQYIMDTMIETLLTYQISDDDRLARKAIDDFHSTRRPDGMIHCNAPASFAQIIPSFAIYYIDMIYYHYQYFGDQELLRTYLPTVTGILKYFEDRIDAETNLVGNTGYWSFVDWVEDWKPNHGSPVSNPDDTLYLYSHMYAYGLLRAAYLYDALNLKDVSRGYMMRYDCIKAAINQSAWDKTSGYYLVCCSEQKHSQHAQLWAVLSGCIDGEDAKNLMRRCMSDQSLLQCSYSMSFYLFRALEKAGVYDEVPDKWRNWKLLLDYGVTTWPEDNVTQRSECHAWSAIPLYDFIAVTLGVRPAKPGYDEILIKPASLYMGDMQADIATTKGTIRIKRHVLKEENAYHVSLEIKLPAVLPVHICPTESECVTFTQKEIAYDYTVNI